MADSDLNYDESVIVVDIGSYSIKAGLAGDDLPKVIAPNMYTASSSLLIFITTI